MSTGIRQLHWDVLPPDLALQVLPGRGDVVAVWPAPVDGDHCFDQAGFHEFEDSDDRWDREWREVVARVLATLEHVGPACVRKEIEVYEFARSGLIRRLLGWLFPETLPKKRLLLSLADQLTTATMDDRFGKVLVDFGNPPEASLLAGEGHPILWISLQVGCSLTPERLVAGAAADRANVRTSLQWDWLIPQWGDSATSSSAAANA